MGKGKGVPGRGVEGRRPLSNLPSFLLLCVQMAVPRAWPGIWGVGRGGGRWVEWVGEAGNGGASLRARCGPGRPPSTHSAFNLYADPSM